MEVMAKAPGVSSDNSDCYSSAESSVAAKPQMEKMWKKPSEQYGDWMPPEIQPMLEIKGGYPCCQEHGSLLCFKGDVWRCIECGWAVIVKVR